jgi:hypothetical protein
METILKTVDNSNSLPYALETRIEIIPVGKFKKVLKHNIYAKIEQYVNTPKYFFNGIKKFGIKQDDGSDIIDSPEIVDSIIEGVHSVYKTDFVCKVSLENDDYVIFFFQDGGKLHNICLEFNNEDNGYYLYNAYEKYLETNPEILTKVTDIEEFFVIEEDIPFLDEDNGIYNSVIEDFDDITFETYLPQSYETPSYENKGKTYPTSAMKYLKDIREDYPTIITTHNPISNRLYLDYGELSDDRVKKIIFKALNLFIDDIPNATLNDNITFYRLARNEFRFSSNTYIMYIVGVKPIHSSDNVLMRYGITHDLSNRRIYLSEYNYKTLTTEDYNMKENTMKTSILYNPYETTYGKMLNITSIQRDLVKFHTSLSGEKLNYEYGNDLSTELMIITGFSHDEKALPVFDHPLVFTSLKGLSVVAVDFRKYSKTVADKPTYISEIAKDVSSLNSIMLRAILTAEWIDGNTGVMRNLDANFASGFAGFVSGLLSIIAGFNPVEKVNVEVALTHYYYSMMIPIKDRAEMQNNIHARVARTPLSLPLTMKVVEGILKDVRHDISDIDGMIYNIKSVVGEDKRDFVNTDALLNLMATMWYGPGGAEAMYMSLEHAPTWIAIMSSAVTDNTFKRSRLSTVLDKLSAKTKPKDIEKGISNYLKEKIV